MYVYYICLFSVLEIIGYRQNVCKSAEYFHAKFILTSHRAIREESGNRVRYLGLLSLSCSVMTLIIEIVCSNNIKQTNQMA